MAISGNLMTRMGLGGVQKMVWSIVLGYKSF